MKKILITGQNSYIGNKFAEWVSQWPDEYQITKTSVRNDDWKNQNWGIYDVVLNVAGIAHQRITKESESDYYKVNRDLAIDLANKAKNDGVKHFIQISTMSVFGIDTGKIDKNTPCNPINAYGKSKLEADSSIFKLKNDSFNITIVRPPMVYGPNCKGNYTSLKKLAKVIPFFPSFENKRSMIFIDNLSQFIMIIINKEIEGYMYPQNTHYVATKDMVKQISKANNHSIIFVDVLNPIIALLNVKIINKIFKDLIYDKSMSSLDLKYDTVDFVESIRLSEYEKK